MIPRVIYLQSGSSLLESLVALFVFAIGALGIAALQATSLVHSDDITHRSVVIWKAQDLVERVRSNRLYGAQQELKQAYVDAVGNSSLASIGNASHNGFKCPTVAPKSCASSSTDFSACTISEQAQFDVWSVFCEPAMATELQGANGQRQIRDLDIALVQQGNQYHLFIEWAHHPRSTAQLRDVQGSTEQSMCQQRLGVELSLGVYCVSFF